MATLLAVIPVTSAIGPAASAGGHEPCKSVLVNAPEIENAVLQAAGIEQTGLTSKEEEVALQGAIRRVVFKADTGSIEIEFEPRSEQPR